MTLGIALGDVKLTSSCFHAAPATQFCADFNGSGRLELWNQQSVSVFYAPCTSAIGDGELLLFLKASTFTWEWMNEWMMHLYIALCIAVHPKCFHNHVGGSLLNHHQCAASTWMMIRLPQDNHASALTTQQLQVERRESHRTNQVDGDY